MATSNEDSNNGSASVRKSVGFAGSTLGNGKPRQRSSGEQSPRANLRCFGSGLNFFWQLSGEENSQQRYEEPKRMEWLETMRPSTMSCGGHFTYAISEKDGGAVYRWGTDNGQVYRTPDMLVFPDREQELGRGDIESFDNDSQPAPIPLSIASRPRALNLCCGTRHTLILVEGGFVYGVGIGYFGQLGCGDDASTHSPRLIKTLAPQNLNGDRVFSVAAGGCHSGALTKKGDIYMWGFNRSSQCGITSRSSTTVSVPTLINGLSEVKEAGIPVQLECGRHHSTVLTDSGAVFSWGATSFGRLGIHDLSAKKMGMPKRVTTLDHFAVHAIAAGDFHMLALTRDRRVFSWGYGGEGQCGHGGGLHLRTPRPIEALKHVLVSKISCSGWYSTCLSADGYLYAWGYGDGGWLGVPKTTNSGNNGSVADEICSFDSAHNQLVPVMVSALKEYQVTQVFCGDSHMISLSIARPENESQGSTNNGSAMNSLTISPINKPSSTSIDNQALHAREEQGSVTPQPLVYSQEPPYSQSDYGNVGASEADWHGQVESGQVGNDAYWQTPAATASGAGDGGEDVEEEDEVSDDGSELDEKEKLNRHVFSCQRHSRLDEVQKALDKGYDINTRDENGNTLLLIAAQNGLKGAVKLCLRNHCDLNLKNKRGNTALHYCFKYGHSELGAYLIKKGADDTLLNNAGLTVYEGI